MTIQFLTLHNVHVRKNESFMVVGTAVHYGEDYPCTGRLLLFQIMLQDALSEPQSQNTAARLVYSR